MDAGRFSRFSRFGIFKGPTHKQMPNLIASGLVPASAVQIMRGFLGNELDLHSCGKYYDSSDVIIHHPDGKMKLVWDSEDFHKLDTESPLSVGDLVLPDGAWESLEGEEFSRDVITKYAGIEQLKGEVLGNPFWQWLARDNQKVLGEYAEKMLGREKDYYRDYYGMGTRPYIPKGMSIFIGNPKIDTPVLRHWRLEGMAFANYDGREVSDTYTGRASAGFRNGDGFLGSDYGRLAGIAAAEHIPKSARKNGDRFVQADISRRERTRFDELAKRCRGLRDGASTNAKFNFPPERWHPFDVYNKEPYEYPERDYRFGDEHYALRVFYPSKY